MIKIEYDDWYNQLKDCRQCKLFKTRTQVVISDGNRNSNIMFVGEAPGFEEDKQGLPFVGRSGKLLRKVLNDIELTTNDYYITNIVKCRPPNNRDPDKDELNTCGNHLIEQILHFVNPKIIVGVGRISSGIMMNGYIQKIHHGTIFHRGSYDFMGTYHPSAGLRNPDWKNKMIADLTLLKRYK